MMNILLTSGDGASTVQTVIDSIISGMTTAASNLMSAIAGVVPVVLPVVAAIAVVGIGIKVFKKVTGRN